jgi:hypothetical protein
MKDTQPRAKRPSPKAARIRGKRKS